ncbi:hypothetical protein PQX77_013527 [Marasmius sp. AFHP31]|nr:hypothetical protein PQX77_013527 [Marasmius sp. AFHP31]
MQDSSQLLPNSQPPYSYNRSWPQAPNSHIFPSPSPSAERAIHSNQQSSSLLHGLRSPHDALQSIGETEFRGLSGRYDSSVHNLRDSMRYSHYPSPSPSLPPTRFSTPFLAPPRHSTPAFEDQGFRGFPPSSLPPRALQSPAPSLSTGPQHFFKPPPISQPRPALYGSGSQHSYVRDRASPERVLLRPLGTPRPLTWEEPQVCDNVDARSIRAPAPTPLSPLSPISVPSQEEKEVDSLSSSLARNLAPTVTQASDAALDALLEPLGSVPPTTPASSRVSLPLANSAATTRSTLPSPGQLGTLSQNPSWSVAGSNEQQSSAPKASMGTAEKELKRYTTDRKLSKAVAEFVKNYDEAVVNLARDLNVDPGRIRKLIGFHRQERAKKEPTPYQAGLFKKARMVNEDREKGDRVKLQEMHRLLRDDKRMMAEIEKGLKSSKVRQWIEELKAVREEKFNGERGSEKAIAREATSTMENVKLEMENMSRSTGAFTFAFMCRSEFGSSVSPAYWGLGPIEDFLWVKFKMTGFDFVSGAQAFACLDACGEGADGRTKQEKDKALRKIATTMILKGLQEILGPTVKNVRMEYKYYEVNIVRVHGVKLVNWPADIPFDSPSNIKSAEQARTIYDLVRSATIRWEKLNKSARAKEVERIDRQIREGVLHPPTRSTRSDKGGTHKKRQRDSDGDNNGAVNGDDNNDNDTPPPPTKRPRKSAKNSGARKAKATPTPAPKSAEFIEQSDSEEEVSAVASATVTNPSPQQASMPSGSSSPFETHNLPSPPDINQEDGHSGLGRDALRLANPGLDDDELDELLRDLDADAEEVDMDGLFGGNDDVDDLYM